MPKVGEARWDIQPVNPEIESSLASALHITPLTARILVQRGHDTPDKAAAFLQPRLQSLGNPLVIGPFRDAAARLWQAVDRRERIVLYGDYDVDGVTSTALLETMLRFFGAEVGHFLPHRLDEGYGLNKDGIERCLAETNPQLLVAVDCGTTAVREIDALQERGIEVIVLDHHQPSTELPRCLLVNPKVFPDRPHPSLLNLATVGVVFKLCHAFLKLGRELGRPNVAEFDLKTHLDLVAIGTIADVVPLDGENRILVRAGLQELARSRKVGLDELMAIAQVPRTLDTYHVAFQLAPRLNAMGRLGDALASLELLLTDSVARARDLAATLNEHNRQRQDIEHRTIEEAMAMVDTVDPEQRVIVLAKEGWHVGVIGIVAARVMRQFHRPAVVIGIDGDGMGKGSCRSIEAFNLIEGLRQCESLLERYGGHQAAAGLSIRAERVEEFRRRINDAALGMLPREALDPRVRIAAEVSAGDISPKFMDELSAMEPFGQGNRTPVLAARRMQLKSPPRIVGRNHLKLWLTDGAQTIDAIGFGMGEWQPNGDAVDVAFSPVWNEFQGEQRIQWKLMDVRDSR